MDYAPDQWAIVKVYANTPHFRVFASWSGGYLDGDSWKLNSGIEKVIETDDTYEFVGYSGSKYTCKKDCEGINKSTYNINALTKLCYNSSGLVKLTNIKDFLSEFDGDYVNE